MSSEGGSTRVLGLAPVAPAASLPPGATVGDWRIVRQIAAGGFGVVYEVVHVGHGTRGALKALHGHLLTSPEMVARLVREAQVIAQLRHPNIVELLAADTDLAGQPYLVMEYLEGEDLGNALAVRGRLAPYEYPREIEFIDALPMTTTGKVQRKELRKREESKQKA